MTISGQQFADFMKSVPPSGADIQTIDNFLNVCISVGTDLGLKWFVDSGLSKTQVCSVIKSAADERLERGAFVSSYGLARGFLLPTDQRSRIEQINSNRQLFQSVGTLEQELETIAQACKELIALADSYDEGKLDFSKANPAAQVSSFSISVDGISQQTGDALVDILGYQPDADSIKRKRAIDSLLKLDFSKRKPYLLFTADVIVDGKRNGQTIVCWQKMHDASGYSIKKRDVFANVDSQPAIYTNASVTNATNELLNDNNFNQILSFYDWINRNDICAVVDTGTVADTLYSYVVSGMQLKAPANSFIFDVPTNSVYLNQAQIDQLKLLNQSDSPLQSPYPLLSQIIFGDESFGWVLSGCNVLASVRRNEDSTATRSLSFLGSNAQNIVDFISQGKIVAPSNIFDVQQAVEKSISAYGVSQTLLSILDGTGTTMFVQGKDDPAGIKPTTQSVDSATNGLSKIIGAIDPASATINPDTLIASLTSARPSTSNRYNSIQIENFSSGPSLKFVSGNKIIDLTTYEGISKLMIIVRTIYDFYPGALL